MRRWSWKSYAFVYYASKNECIWKDVDRTKYMSFMIKDNKLPEKHNKIWDDSESVYHEKFSQIVGSNF